MHELLADVVDELLGAATASGSQGGAAAADAWMLVTDIATEPYRDNALGALSNTTSLTVKHLKFGALACLPSYSNPSGC